MASEIKTKELPPLPSKIMEAPKAVEMPKVVVMPEIGVVKPEVKAALPEGPIKVEAIRDGFYKRCRLVAGDKFIIDNKTHFGSWMKLI